MTPNMQKILEEFDKIPLCYPDLEGDDTEQYYAGQAHMKQHLKEFIRRSCVEYSQAVVPSAVLSTSPAVEYGYGLCIKDIKENIQQDSLDLPTN